MAAKTLPRNSAHYPAPSLTQWLSKAKAAKPLGHLLFFYGPSLSWLTPAPELFFDLLSWILLGSRSRAIDHHVTEVAAVSFPASQCRAKEDARLPPGIQATLARHDAALFGQPKCFKIMGDMSYHLWSGVANRITSLKILKILLFCVATIAIAHLEWNIALANPSSANRPWTCWVHVSFQTQIPVMDIYLELERCDPQHGLLSVPQSAGAPTLPNPLDSGSWCGWRKRFSWEHRDVSEMITAFCKLVHHHFPWSNGDVADCCGYPQSSNKAICGHGRSPKCIEWGSPNPHC